MKYTNKDIFRCTVYFSIPSFVLTSSVQMLQFILHLQRDTRVIVPFTIRFKAQHLI